MKEYRIGKPRYFLTTLTLIGYCGIGLWIVLYGAWGNALRYIVGPIIIIFTLLFAVPTVYFSKCRWVVTDKQLKIMNYDSFMNQCIDFYQGLFKSEHYQVCLELVQIESITITYKKLYMLYYGYSRKPVYFVVKSKTGDILQFNALVSKDYQTIIEAVQYLETKGVAIKDPYHILTVLKEQKSLAKYLDNVSKEEK